MSPEQKDIDKKKIIITEGSINKKLPDIIVYQMGKVASTSICETLSEENLNAQQSHFLGKKNLSQTLFNLLNPNISDFSAFHTLGQFVKNIELTRTINWYKQNKEKDGKKLKIISLSRDPIDWTRANLVQNFPEYSVGFEKWCEITKKNNTLPSLDECVRSVYESVFDIIGTTKEEFGTDRFFDSIRSMELEKNPETNIILHHIYMLSRPLNWYDNFVKPILGIDVFKKKFNSQLHYNVYTKDYCDFLLIRYEDLDKIWSIVAEFAGSNSKLLSKLNVGQDKKNYLEIKNGMDRAILNKKNSVSVINKTKYCEFFHYYR